MSCVTNKSINKANTIVLLSRLSGLFNGVISQSGSPLAEWALDRNPWESAQYMAGRLGCPTDTSQNLVNCMRTLSWEEIVEEQSLSQEEAYANLDLGLATVTPTIEPDLAGAFIAEDPQTLMETGDIPDVPLMLGTTLHEGSYVLAELWLAKLGPENLTDDAEWLREQMIPSLLKTFGVTEGPGSSAVSQSVSLAYLSGSLRNNWDDLMPGLVDVSFIGSFLYINLKPRSKMPILCST